MNGATYYEQIALAKVMEIVANQTPILINRTHKNANGLTDKQTAALAKFTQRVQGAPSLTFPKLCQDVFGDTEFSPEEKYFRLALWWAWKLKC